VHCPRPHAARFDRSALLGAALALVVIAAPARAPAEELLQGPHPFRKDNELDVQGGYGTGNGFGGIRAGIGYGYQAAGSVWFDLRVDLIDARGESSREPLDCTAPCAKVSKYTHVMAGVKYKLRTNLPIIPYAGVAAGPMYLFNRGAGASFGLGAHGSVGARYFLYDWLGFGLELGATVGGASVPQVPGLESGLRILDIAAGAEVQF
jgi:hypothetical protein